MVIIIVFQVLIVKINMLNEEVSDMFAIALKVVQIVLDVVMIVCIIQLKKEGK